MMRKPYLLLVGLLLLLPLSVEAQNLEDLLKVRQDPAAAYKGLAAGLGTTVINGKVYFLIHAAPQIPIGNFEVGLDGNIRLDENGKLRREDWDETYDYFRLINYISYGQTRDKNFARIGGLRQVTIGNGTIVDNYSNNSSYDNRRIGLAGRGALGLVGVELLVADLFAPGVAAIRPFVQPFQLTPLRDTWFLGDLQVGATWASDFDSNAGRIIPNREPFVHRDPEDSSKFVYNNNGSLEDKGNLTIFGADIAAFLFRGDNYEGRVYADFVKFQEFNQGFIFGTHLSYVMDSTFGGDIRFERSLFQNRFLPNYYNSFYEQDRFDNVVERHDFVTKATLLSDTTSGNGNGFRFANRLTFGRLITTEVHYSHLDNLPYHDLLDSYVSFPDLGLGFFGAFSYSRKDIEGFSDLFALDERSLLNAKLSWQPLEYIITSAIFRWTFSRDENNNLNTQYFVEPKVDFVFKL